jgi:hypothetical protein
VDFWWTEETRVLAKSGIFRYLVLPAVLVFCVVAVSAQDLPRSIRGYKVHLEKSSAAIKGAGISQGSGAAISIAEPYLVDVSLTGLTFDLFATLTDVRAAGHVDFLTFHDFRVNGIPVEVEDYVHAFRLQKGELVRLPRPIRIFVPSQRILQAAWHEVNSPAADWTVTGRVFVFGKFRKFGIQFKRVIPVEIDIAIKNPLVTRPRP